MTHSAGSKWAEVDVAALRDNTRALHDLVGDSCSVMAMVKANGYGHGAVPVAQAAPRPYRHRDNDGDRHDGDKNGDGRLQHRS